MKKNYVLIHGAWHGSWCFNKVTPLLEKLEAKVYALDLPGHYHNLADFNTVTLETYVNFVCNFIANNIEGKTVLVGHSMGGIVISQVAQNLPNKISHLAYICAFVPDNHSSLLIEDKKAKVPSVALKINLDKDNCAINLAPNDCKALFYNSCSEEDVNFALPLLQNQPLLPFGDTVALGKNFDNIPKTYIECLRDKAIFIDDQRRMNKVCKHIFSIDTDHSPFFSASDRLAEILSSILP